MEFYSIGSCEIVTKMKNFSNGTLQVKEDVL